MDPDEDEIASQLEAWGEQERYYDNPPEPEFSPTSEQEFRRASMAPLPPGPDYSDANTPAGQPEPSQGPEIYNQGVRQQSAPIRERAFRPFNDGSGGGTLDPMATGRPLPDEVMIRHTEQQLQSMSLSQSERMRLQGLQNARSRVQTELASGALTGPMGQQLMSQIDAQAQPMMIRASQLPTLQRLLQFRVTQQQMAQATAREQERYRFRALTAEERTHTYTDENGRVHRMIEQPNGQMVRLNEGNAEATAQHRTAQQRQQSITAATRAVDRRIQDGDLEPGGRVAAIVAAVREMEQVEQQLSGQPAQPHGGAATPQAGGRQPTVAPGIPQPFAAALNGLMVPIAQAGQGAQPAPTAPVAPAAPTRESLENATIRRRLGGAGSMTAGQRRAWVEAEDRRVAAAQEALAAWRTANPESRRLYGNEAARSRGR